MYHRRIDQQHQRTSINLSAVASIPPNRVKIGLIPDSPLPEASSPPLLSAAIRKHLGQNAVQMHYINKKNFPLLFFTGRKLSPPTMYRNRSPCLSAPYWTPPGALRRGYIGVGPPPKKKSITVLFTCGTLTRVLKLQ